ncbi:UNVERIFIED_CONTAM: hypothetical protein NCL1_58642 [Trichonephila clavipes]
MTRILKDRWRHDTRIGWFLQTTPRQHPYFLNQQIHRKLLKYTISTYPKQFLHLHATFCLDFRHSLTRFRTFRSNPQVIEMTRQHQCPHLNFLLSNNTLLLLVLQLFTKNAVLKDKILISYA